MTEFSEKLNKVKQAVQLNVNSKSVMRAQLTAYMEQHPVLPVEVKPSVFARFMGMFSLVTLKPFPLVALIVVIFLVATAGTAAAAENALPGQLLYTWKIDINEKVQLQLIRNEDQKAEFEMTLASHRLAEAEALARKGKLPASVQQQIRASFEQHSGRAQARVAKLEADNNEAGAAQLKQKLSAVIESHQQQLLDIGVSTDVDIDDKLNMTDNAILSSQAVVNLETKSEKNSQKDSVRSRRQANIQKAQDLLNQARVKLNAGQTEDALKLNQEAIVVNRQAVSDQFNENDPNRSRETEKSSDSGHTGSDSVPKIEIRSK